MVVVEQRDPLSLLGKMIVAAECRLKWWSRRAGILYDVGHDREQSYVQ